MKKLDYDIIVLALPRWDGLYSSTAFSLSKELSRHTRVYYIDNPFTLKDFALGFSSRQQKRRRSALLRGKEYRMAPDPAFPNLIAVTPRLVLPINWLPQGALYDFFARINDGILFQTLKKLIADERIQRFVFINSFNPLYANFFPSTFRPVLFIYHCVDDISRSKYISRHGTRLESEQVKRADLTLVTSRNLEKLKSAETKNVFYLPNAADVELFQKAFYNGMGKPAEIQKIPDDSKIILYFGNICHRIDYGLVLEISERHPDKFVVMVGPETTNDAKDIGLHRKPNIIFTGRKSLEELPAYLHYSDVCIIPFRIIPLTESIYPLKINEYLSGGKPVVTTNFSQDIASFAEVVYVSATHEEFVQNISEAIKDDTAEKAKQRITFTAGNNWKNRAAELVARINNKLEGHEGRR